MHNVFRTFLKEGKFCSCKNHKFRRYL